MMRHWVLLAALACCQAIEGTFSYADVQVNYLLLDQRKASAPVVLLLHGAKYTSETWRETSTLAFLQGQGYKVLAIDLPGFGKTPKLPYMDDNARADVVLAAANFGLKGNSVPLILVSPSMSGKWAMSFIDRHGTNLAAWVAIAPVGLSSWPGPSATVHRQVKLLAMFGENDRLKEESPTLTKFFASSQAVIIPGAGHACYVDKPHDFHRELLAFLVRAASVPAS